MSGTPIAPRPPVTPAAPCAGKTAAHTPQALARDPRGDRAAFERALARHARARGDHAGESDDALDESAPPPAVDRNGSGSGSDADTADASPDGREPRPDETGLPPAEGDRAAALAALQWRLGCEPSAAVSTGAPNDHGDSDQQRRWLNQVLQALDEAVDERHALGSLRHALVVSTRVPGIGEVRLELRWPGGTLSVNLQPGAASGSQAIDLIDNGHVQSLQRALAARRPPIPLEVTAPGAVPSA